MGYWDYYRGLKGLYRNSSLWFFLNPQKMGKIMAQNPQQAIILHTFGVQVGREWGKDSPL